jgi:hypothetical protein
MRCNSSPVCGDAIRRERPRTEPVAAQAGQPEYGGNHPQQQAAKVVEDGADFIEGEGHQGGVRFTRGGQRARCHAEAPPPDVDCIAPLMGGREDRLPRQRQHHRARGIAQLDQAAVGNFADEFREFLLELGAVFDFGVRAQSGLQTLDALREAHVYAGDQTLFQREPHDGAEERETGEQGRGVPGGEPHPDGEAHYPPSARRQ